MPGSGPPVRVPGVGTSVGPGADPGGRGKTDNGTMAEFAKEVLQVNIEEEMKQSYLDYAMSVIVGRALPDVRDGLKPVHRRVLYALFQSLPSWLWA